MALKDRFEAGDWNEIVRAPMLASFAVTAADPGGLWGTVKEAAASARALAAARDGGAGALSAEVAAAYATAEGRDIGRDAVQSLLKGRSPREASGMACERLRTVGRIVDEFAPDEAPAFRAWVRDIARQVAEAATEGGFLGFGGAAVSKDERRTLDEIDAALAGPETGGPEDRSLPV